MRAIFHLVVQIGAQVPKPLFAKPKEYRRHDATAPRWSQIAAVLLFELGTIDIRCMGTT